MSSDDSPLLFPKSPRIRKNALREFHAELSNRVTGGRTFTCLITRDAALRRLNRQFLSHDYPTDVLSFPASAGGETCGDLAISIDRAKAQAANQGHSLEDELRILMLHGALHLAGFDHERDRGEMARAEKRWRKRFGLPDGLIERNGSRTVRNGTHEARAQNGRAQR